MACIKSCKVCETQTCDTDLCGMCQEVIARQVIDGLDYDRDVVKSIVEDKRGAALKLLMKQNLEAAMRCPRCGK